MVRRKGSKRIVVDQVAYRYVGYLNGYQQDKFLGQVDEVTIGAEAMRGEVLRASFTYEIIRLAYLQVGRTLGKFGTFPPFVVAETIRLGLLAGWTPTSGGGLKNLGNLDTAIDFTALARDVT